MLQPSSPIVVEVLRQREAARDISIDAVLGIFALAGAFLAAGLVVALLGAGSFLLFRQIQDRRSDRRDSGLTTLHLSTDDPPPSQDHLP